MASEPQFDWPGLQLAEHFEAQRRGWVVDRIGWVVLLIVVLAALLGLFGNGVLGSSGSSGAGGLIEVDYNRFGRYGADLTLTVRVDEEGIRDGEIGIWLPDAYLRGVRMDDISPTPDRVESLAGGRLHTFLVPQDELAAVFDLTGNHIGVLEGAVGLGGPDRVATFSQFLYP